MYREYLQLSLLLGLCLIQVACGRKAPKEGDVQLQNDLGVCFPQANLNDQIDVDRQLASQKTQKDKRQLQSRIDGCVPIEDHLVYRAQLKTTNQKGMLTWSESYTLATYLYKYKTTLDRKHLAAFTVNADALLQKQDSDISFAFRQPTWSSVTYTIGIPYTTSVSVGRLAFPMAEFSAIIMSDSELSRTRLCDGRSLGEVAQLYLEQVKEMVAALEHRWSNDGGYKAPDYTLPFWYGGSTPWATYKYMPFNQSHAVGNLLIMLYRNTQDPSYRIKIQKMAQAFKSHLTLDSAKNAYTWLYHYAGDFGEDISHAGDTIRFITLCHEEGIVFTFEDMQRFSNTFLKLFHKGGDQFINRLGKDKPLASESKQLIAFWLPLSPYNPNVLKLVSRFEPSLQMPYTKSMFEYYTTKKAKGESCSDHTDCLSGYCKTKKCHALLVNNAACDSNQACQSRTCLNKKCIASKAWSPPHPVATITTGQACQVDYSCQSNICENKVCISAKSAGQTCSRSVECKTGLCIESTCKTYTPCQPTTQAKTN